MAYYVFISAADLCVIVCQMSRGSNPPFSFFPLELNLTDKCLDGALNNNNYESEVLQVRPAHVRYCSDIFCVSFLFVFYNAFLITVICIDMMLIMSCVVGSPNRSYHTRLNKLNNSKCQGHQLKLTQNSNYNLS